MEPLNLFPLILYSATLGATVVCGVTRGYRVARWTGVLGFLTLGCGLLGLLTSAFLTWSAMSAPGLMQTDRQRMLANGIAEALYNGVFTVVAALPALLVSHWVVRKHAARS